MPSEKQKNSSVTVCLNFFCIFSISSCFHHVAQPKRPTTRFFVSWPREKKKKKEKEKRF